MRRHAFALLISTVIYPTQLAAQVRNPNAPGWIGDFTTASANVLLSGLTAGITQELKGGSFRDGFTRGALGGLVIYGGKRIAAEDFAGAGLVGREVAGVGSSMVRNAADAVGTFDRVVLPAGIARIYWSRSEPRNWQVKVDASALGWMIYGIAERRLEFDTAESLSSGTPVFATRNRIIVLDYYGEAAGMSAGGLIFLSDVSSWSEASRRSTRAHERIHVLQTDQLFLTINEPHDDIVLRLLPFGRHVNRWVDLNLATEVIGLFSLLIENHSDRPLEMEANYLSR